MILNRLISHIKSSSNFSSCTSSAPRVLKIGDVFKQSREFNELDLVDFKNLTLDDNPLHFDSEYARKAGFTGRIVHGMLVASLFPMIIASHFPGAVYVSQNLRFKSPVYICEVVVAEMKAIGLKESKNKCIVRFSTKCFKEGRDLAAIDGEAVALLPTLTFSEVGEKNFRAKSINL